MEYTKEQVKNVLKLFNGTIVTERKKMIFDEIPQKENTPFLKLTSLEDGATMTILGNVREIDGNYGKQLCVDIEMKGQRFTLPINATSKMNLISCFGVDSEKWNGKSAIVRTTHSKKYNKTYKIVSGR
ncbi:MAG: hypothetical protein EOM19_05315 [Candidatus Moranbacteria bacterium]|nr:hypothetical protein [Candidatus Moranbacteria bacterium]